MSGTTPVSDNANLEQTLVPHLLDEFEIGANKEDNMTTNNSKTLEELAEGTATRRDFCVFLEALACDFDQRPQEWENVTVGAYLEATAAFAEAIDGYYRNTSQAIDAEQATWRMFAEILLAGKVYE